MDRIALEFGISRDDWRFLLDFLPDAALLHDGKNILYANLAACRLWGVPEAPGLAGRSFLELVHEDDRNLVMTRITGVFHGRPSELKEYRIVALDGEVKDIEAKATRVEYERVVCNMVVLRDITTRKRQRNELIALNARLDAMRRQQTILSRHLINSHESKRGDLAMELHDRIGQQLSSLKMNLEWTLAGSGDGMREVIAASVEALRDAIMDLKRMASELMPSVIANLGLSPSLKSLRDDTANRTGLSINLFSQGLDRRYGRAIELTVYRVVQEALNNAAKHARAKNCHISVVAGPASISIGVEDDGIGFDAEASVLGGGNGSLSLGLHIMRERVAQLGGEFSIDSGIGRGTIVLAVIPLEGAAHVENA